MDVFVVPFDYTGVAGATGWWDGIKVEESIIATPWNPASVGATTVDAGGVQIDGTRAASSGTRARGAGSVTWSRAAATG